MESKQSVGFVGLGLLGLPMAANLIDRGHSLRVHNRTRSKADPLVAKGAEAVDRPADVVTPGGVVVSCLWDDASVEELVESAGFLQRLGTGGVHVSMTTILPETAERLALLHRKHGSEYVAAPVFGRPEAAVARKLALPIAGPAAAKARVRPLLEAMGGEKLFDFGEAVGAGTVVKLAGNFLLVSAAQAMSEALSMAEMHQVDQMAVVEMLTSTLFPCPIYKTYGTMVAQKSTALGQSKIPQKDVGLFKQTAETVGSPTPFSGHLYQVLAERSKASSVR